MLSSFLVLLHQFFVNERSLRQFELLSVGRLTAPFILNLVAILLF
ncbi:MAG: hypothetical protein AAFR77_13115 [Cyanobacteria bacterium J06631_2]